MTLSVLIPSRHEPWLNRTVHDALRHSQDSTEVIVVLDGAWPAIPLPQHPRLVVVHLPTSIGQRQATNLAARVSRARLVMKLDAHCALPEGYDVALEAGADRLGPDVVQVPRQYNLHVFDWVCTGCGARTYQGPLPTGCQCGHAEWTREEVWQPRWRRRTDRWRFDADLHFQYWGVPGAPDGPEDVETLSCLGACWCVDRQTYWRLGGLDEHHGSWGQMGTEIACKAWLSGGRLMTNRMTWFAHLFRTQPGFGFPYPISADDQETARRYSQTLWRHHQWPLARYDLAWLLDRFWPVPGWTDAQRDAVRRPA